MIIRLSIAGILAAAFAAGIAVVPPRSNVPVSAGADTIKTIPQPSKDDRARVEWLERSLAHDSMEGRALASAGEHRAAVFLAAQMKKIGLKPGGDDKYFQRVPLAMMVPVAAAAGASRGGGGRGAVGVTPPECLPKAPVRSTPAPTDTVARGRGAAPGGAGAGRGAIPPATGAATAAAATGRGGRSGGGGAPAATAQAPRLRPVTLPSMKDWDTVPKDRQRTAVNVIGILPGRDPVLKNEIVVVLSHFDHLGIRTPAVPGADSIFNGADDDAAGTVAVLEIARLLKKAGKPKRTIVFANMTGEESGMVGTNFWVSHPTFPLSQFVAGFEIEMIGRPDSLAGGPGKAWLTGYERSTMGDMLKQYGIDILPDRRPEQNFFQRSDNYGLARRGIVAHTLSTFNLHTDYHRVTDDVDKIDFDHMTAVIHSAAEAVRHLADGPKPAWHPGCDPSQPPPARP